MKVIVVFDYPDVDVDSEKADWIIDSLTEDLLDFGDDTGNVWYIDDAIQDYAEEE